MKKIIPLLLFTVPFLSAGQIVIKLNDDDGNKIFEKIEIEAGFKGGLFKWNEYVKSNFNFTRIEKSLPDSVAVFSDTANVQFIIDKNGIIKDIKILSNTNPAFQQSCIEIFKDSPHWNPAIQCGRPVSAYKRETFILQINKEDKRRFILVRS